MDHTPRDTPTCKHDIMQLNSVRNLSRDFALCSGGRRSPCFSFPFPCPCAFNKNNTNHMLVNLNLLVVLAVVVLSILLLGDTMNGAYSKTNKAGFIFNMKVCSWGRYPLVSLTTRALARALASQSLCSCPISLLEGRPWAVCVVSSQQWQESGMARVRND